MFKNLNSHLHLIATCLNMNLLSKFGKYFDFEIVGVKRCKIPFDVIKVYSHPSNSILSYRMNVINKEEIKRLRRSGIPVQQIADMFNLSRHTIWKATRDIQREVACPQCGHVFTAKLANRRFCSTYCRVKHSRGCKSC